MQTKFKPNIDREFPRPFGERFQESYLNCPKYSVVVLCPCGNTFHKKNWVKEKFCSQICFHRYAKQESSLKEIKEVLER